MPITIPTVTAGSDNPSPVEWANDSVKPALESLLVPWVTPPVNTSFAPSFLTNTFENQTDFNTTIGGNGGVPFIVTEQITVDRLFCRVNTADAGATLRMGLWLGDFEDTNLPGTLITSGTVTPSATGINALTISEVLLPGRIYWAALAASSAATLRLRSCHHLMMGVFSGYTGSLNDAMGNAPRWSMQAGTWDAPANNTGFGYGLPDRCAWLAMRRSA